MNKLDFLQTYLDLYINHHQLLQSFEQGNSPYEILDIRNAPNFLKKEQIKGAKAIPAKELRDHLSDLDRSKIYVVYDWNSGTILGKQALLMLLSEGFEAYELAGALEGWKAMGLPLEAIETN